MTSVLLNGIVLDGMVLVNEFNGDQASVSVKRTINGKTVLHNAVSYDTNRKLSLVSNYDGKDFVWFDRSVVDNLDSLARSASVVSLVYNGRNFNVIVLSVKATPLVVGSDLNYSVYMELNTL